MPNNVRSLFDLVIPETSEHALFRALRTQSVSEPARWVMNEVFKHFKDPDGNFVEQLQSTGFDARIFELYLFAYLHFSGFDIDRSHPNPDFVVTRDDITVAIEATTVNPSTSGVLAELGKKIEELSGGELLEYQRHELPLRFGSPLFSKLQRKYWDLPQCKGLPFVLAIEAFHDEDSLGLGDSALSTFLYGLTHTADWDPSGELRIEFDRVYSHVLGTKQVPSSFFDQPDTEHVSAVLFTNSGTTAKFSRMGYQSGVGVDRINMMRMGYCLNMEPTARDATFFSYNVDDPPFVEHWGQGLVVIHNPNCLNPLPPTFFPHSLQTVFDGERPRSFATGWHPITSKTFLVDLGEVKKRLREVVPARLPRVGVAAISKSEFRTLSGFPEQAVVTEEGWFADETNAFLGVILHDTIDDDWGFVVLGVDEFFRFRALETASSLATRDIAREKLQQRIVDRLSHPQRIFWHDSVAEIKRDRS